MAAGVQTLGLLIAHFQARMHSAIGMPLRFHPFAGLARLPLAASGHRLRIGATASHWRGAQKNR